MGRAKRRSVGHLVLNAARFTTHWLESPEKSDPCGHTCNFLHAYCTTPDTRGSSSYNLTLSLNRARAIQSYLLAHYAIDAHHIEVEGYGEECLLVQEDTEAAYALNRRVEIVLIVPGVNATCTPTDHAASRQPSRPSVATGFYYFEAGSTTPIAMQPDGATVLRTGQHPYQIYFRVDQPVYVYLFQEDSSGHLAVLFPNPHTLGQRNPVRPQKAYWLPGYNEMFTLDDTTGTETLYVMASKKRLTHLESLMAADTSWSTTEITRGLKEVRAKPKPERNWHLRDIAKQVESHGGFVQTFQFEHR